eukprot:654861-Prorocentrum_minimum.AAC.1
MRPALECVSRPASEPIPSDSYFAPVCEGADEGGAIRLEEGFLARSRVRGGRCVRPDTDSAQLTARLFPCLEPGADHTGVDATAFMLGRQTQARKSQREVQFANTRLACNVFKVRMRPGAQQPSLVPTT